MHLFQDISTTQSLKTLKSCSIYPNQYVDSDHFNAQDERLPPISVIIVTREIASNSIRCIKSHGRYWGAPRFSAKSLSLR